LGENGHFALGAFFVGDDTAVFDTFSEVEEALHVGELSTGDLDLSCRDGDLALGDFDGGFSLGDGGVGDGEFRFKLASAELNEGLVLFYSIADGDEDLIDNSGTGGADANGF
jgi:hypothetical protein